MAVRGIYEPEYIMRRMKLGNSRYNGAYYYAKEIQHNMVPLIDTDRDWVLLNNIGCTDGAIVFVHNNLHPENYDWLSEYDDLVLVCGIPETVPKVAHLGHAVYLPLSVDVAEVERFKLPKKTCDVAFFGRKSKGQAVPQGVRYITGMERDFALHQVAQCRRVYAVGRCAIEARVLGCKILPYDPRFPNPRRWKVLDNKEAAEMLQEKLDAIGG